MSDPIDDPCPHCGLPATMPEVCTPELNEAIEAGIVRDWALLNAGFELGLRMGREAAIPTEPGRPA